MARSANHPLKSLSLFLVVCGLGWAAWEYIHVRGVLDSESVAPVASEICDEARDAILAHYQDDYCLDQIDPIHYRAGQEHYRIRFTVPHDCMTKARSMCEEIAAFSSDILGASVGVFAFDPAGNEVAKFVQ